MWGVIGLERADGSKTATIAMVSTRAKPHLLHQHGSRESRRSAQERLSTFCALNLSLPSPLPQSHHLLLLFHNVRYASSWTAPAYLPRSLLPTAATACQRTEPNRVAMHPTFWPCRADFVSNPSSNITFFAHRAPDVRFSSYLQLFLGDKPTDIPYTARHILVGITCNLSVTCQCLRHLHICPSPTFSQFVIQHEIRESNIRFENPT